MRIPVILTGHKERGLIFWARGSGVRIAYFKTFLKFVYLLGGS